MPALASVAQPVPVSPVPLRLLIAVFVVVGCTAEPAALPLRSVAPTTSPVASVTTEVAPTQPAATIAPSMRAPYRYPPQISLVQQVTDRLGFAVVYESPGSILWKTTNGGRSWSQLTVPAYTRIDHLRFIDEQNAWALAFMLRDQPQTGCSQASAATPCGSVVLTTGDGGRTWEQRLSIAGESFAPETMRQLQAVDAMNAWVIARSGACGHDGCPREVRTTNDGGRTWRSVYRPDERGLLPDLLRMASRDVGWMVAQKFLRGGEVVLGTRDGGRTWRELRETVGAVALDAASERDAWVLTRDGAYCSSSTCTNYELLRTSDGGTTWMTLGNPKDQACGGGHIRGPLFASARVGYMGLDLGAGGIDAPGGIMVTANGGRTWNCGTTPRNVTAVSAADPRNAWAVSLDRSTGGTSLYRTTDAGATWEQIAIPVSR